MLREGYEKLSAHAVTTMRKEEGSDEHFLVQIYDLSISKNGKLSCLLSDGNSFCKAIFVQDVEDQNCAITALNLTASNHALICVKNHMLSETTKRIGIIQFDFVCEYAALIGSPQLVENANINITSLPLIVDPSLIKGRMNPIYFQQIGQKASQAIGKMQLQSAAKKKDNNESETRERTAVKQKSSAKTSKLEAFAAAATRDRNERRESVGGDGVGGFQTIRGLYLGMRSWHLLCRIVYLDYNQFIKKGTDKKIELLRVDLMDRSAVKIAGSFFGEAAQKFRHLLKTNSVYKISQGTIQSEDYSASRNEGSSPFRLIFNLQSMFEEVSDVHVVARAEESAPTLWEVVERRRLEQEQDAVAVLVEVSEIVEGNSKNDNAFSRCNCLVADPVRAIVLNLVLWNAKNKIDPTLLGTTVLLNRFILREYRGSPVLDGRNNSSILAVTRHPFQALEQTAISNYKSYERLSEMGGNEQDKIQCLTTKELSVRIEHMGNDETIRSEFRVWVNRTSMKKWYFEGCTHCKKQAESRASCTSCGKYVEKAVPHFIMPLELSDHTGSFWTTAYDQFAKKIFQDEENVIDKLRLYDIDQLKDIMDNYSFQQFRLKVYTKKDKEGRIKHNVGRVFIDSPQQTTIANLQRIRAFLAL